MVNWTTGPIEVRRVVVLDCATGSYGLALNGGQALLLEPVDGEEPVQFGQAIQQALAF